MALMEQPVLKEIYDPETFGHGFEVLPAFGAPSFFLHLHKSCLPFVTHQSFLELSFKTLWRFDHFSGNQKFRLDATTGFRTQSSKGAEETGFKGTFDGSARKHGFRRSTRQIIVIK